MIGQGIHFDVPSETYFSDPCPAPSLTQTIAKILCDSTPAHAFIEHPRLNPPRPDDEPDAEKYVKAQAIGNAAHAIMIGRGKTIYPLAFEDFRTKAAKEARAEVEKHGHVAILKKHHDQAVQMVAAAQRQLAVIPECEGAFTEGHGEVVIIAQDHDNGGIWLRSMIDWMQSPTQLYDLKTSGMSVAPHTLGRMMVDAGWDVQAAMQERILDIVDPDNAGRRTFRFVAGENDEPYSLVVAEMSEAVMTMGRKKLQHAINVWRECLILGEWPQYPARIVVPEYPGFKETDWLNREIAYAEHNEQRQKRGQMLTSLAGG